MLADLRLGVIGAGSMGGALLHGVLAAGIVEPSRAQASRKNPERLDELRERLGVAATTDNRALVASSDVILLAVKPQVFPALFEELEGALRADQLLISVAAGITAKSIEDSAGCQIPVIRAMPNTPALVGAGMSPYCLGRYADPSHGALAEQLLGSVGQTVRVSEEQMDAITATSGSGPAYVFYLVEAMQAAAEDLGLPQALAARLAQQTVFGAAKLLSESSDGPEELRRRVTSPGGTTAAAIQVFEDTAFPTHVRDAMRAACKRAEELGSS